MKIMFAFVIVLSIAAPSAAQQLTLDGVPIGTVSPEWAQTLMPVPIPEAQQPAVIEPLPAGKPWPKWPIRLSIGVSMVANGADLSTTAWARGRDPDQFVEANPILRPFADDPSVLAGAKMTIAVALNWCLVKLYEDHPKLALVLTNVSSVVTGWVAHRNATQLGLR